MGVAQRRRNNQTSKRQLLENKMYTKKPTCLPQLSNFAIIEPKSDPNADTIPCSDIHQHVSGSGESLME